MSKRLTCDVCGALSAPVQAEGSHNFNADYRTPWLNVQGQDLCPDCTEAVRLLLGRRKIHAEATQATQDEKG